MANDKIKKMSFLTLSNLQLINLLGYYQSLQKDAFLMHMDSNLIPITYLKWVTFFRDKMSHLLQSYSQIFMTQGN